MVSLTASLGRRVSAESCARPVTSSRFTSATPLLIQFATPGVPGLPPSGDKKSGVDPLSVPDAASGQAGRQVITISNGGNRLGREERLAAAPLLREVSAA